jgi:hypothetical protein
MGLKLEIIIFKIISERYISEGLPKKIKKINYPWIEPIHD